MLFLNIYHLVGVVIFKHATNLKLFPQNLANFATDYKVIRHESTYLDIRHQNLTNHRILMSNVFVITMRNVRPAELKNRHLVIFSDENRLSHTVYNNKVS